VPAKIGGRRYVDGGPVDDLAGRPERRRCRRRLRVTRLLLREAKMLAAQGKRVVILTPGAQDLAVMGANPMNHKRREAVLETSLCTSAAALAGSESTFRAAA
jgi:hypothetical protein